MAQVTLQSDPIVQNTPVFNSVQRDSLLRTAIPTTRERVLEIARDGHTITGSDRNLIALYHRWLHVPRFNDVYLQHSDGSIYKPGKPITWSHFRRAFEGQTPLHADLVDKWGRTQALAVDQDNATWEDATQARALICKTWGLQPEELHTERTGGTGYHHWVYFTRAWSVELLEEAGRRLLDASKAADLKLDYIAPLNGRTHIRTPLSARNNPRLVDGKLVASGARSQYVRPDGRRVHDGVTYMLEIAKHSVDPVRLTFAPARKKPFDWQPQVDALKQLEAMATLPEIQSPGAKWTGPRRAPACVRWYETHDLENRDMRHRVLYGLIWKWVRLDGLSDEETDERGGRWYEEHYKAGGTPFREHMVDVRSTIKTMRVGKETGKGKFDCQKWPEIWGEHCDDQCRRSEPGVKLAGWAERLKVELTRAAYRLRKLQVADKVGALALEVFKWMGLSERVAVRRDAPKHEGGTIFYTMQRWLGKKLGVRQQSISRAISELVDAGLVLRVPRVMMTSYLGWLRRCHPEIAVAKFRQEKRTWPSYYRFQDVKGEGNSSLNGSSDANTSTPISAARPATVETVTIQTPISSPEPLPAWYTSIPQPASPTTTEKVYPSALDKLRAAIHAAQEQREAELLRDVLGRLGVQEDTRGSYA